MYCRLLAARSGALHTSGRRRLDASAKACCLERSRRARDTSRSTYSRMVHGSVCECVRMTMIDEVRG